MRPPPSHEQPLGDRSSCLPGPCRSRSITVVLPTSFCFLTIDRVVGRGRCLPSNSSYGGCTAENAEDAEGTAPRRFLAGVAAVYDRRCLPLEWFRRSQTAATSRAWRPGYSPTTPADARVQGLPSNSKCCAVRVFQVGRGLCLWAIFAALRLDPPRTSSGAPRTSRPTFCRISAPVTPQPHPPRAGSGTPQ